MSSSLRHAENARLVRTCDNELEDIMPCNACHAGELSK
jgi:hypothetical protein